MLPVSCSTCIHGQIEIYVGILLPSSTLHTRGKEPLLLSLIWHTMHDLQHFIDLKASDSNVVCSLDRMNGTPGVAKLLAACLMTLTKFERIYGVLEVPIRRLGSQCFPAEAVGDSNVSSVSKGKNHFTTLVQVRQYGFL